MCDFREKVAAIQQADEAYISSLRNAPVTPLRSDPESSAWDVRAKRLKTQDCDGIYRCFGSGFGREYDRRWIRPTDKRSS